MTDVYVVGVGMTPFGRMPDGTVRDLTRRVVASALADAGAAVADVGAAFFANATQSALEGQHMIGGEIALRAAGFQGIPVANVENACASASTAFHLAWAHIKAGLCDVALAVGAEKMTHPDKARSLAVFHGAWDVHQGAAELEALLAAGAGGGCDGEASGGGRSVFMDIYAAWAKLHMKTFGTTQRQIAAVAAKNHGHSVHNPLAQYRTPASVEEVLVARTISWPLTLPMCAPVSDGAAAAILCSADALARFDQRRAVRIRATVLGTGTDRDVADFRNHVGHRTARKAYEAAGVAPEDISVAEVHDATAFGEIQQVENLGLCAFGEGGPLAESGATTIGGRIPVNPSGGLVSKGHPIGATGLAQIVELVTQLRGEARGRQVEGARLGIAENGGGFLRGEDAATCITILGN